MLVRDFMVTDLTTLPEDSRLLDAALLIRRTGRRHLPVVGADGKAVGIISDRDVARMAPSILADMTPEEYNRIFESTPVTVAMTRDPMTVRPETPISEAVEILHSHKIGALLVVENGKLAGLLTVTDMLGLLRDLLAEKARAAGGA